MSFFDENENENENFLNYDCCYDLWALAKLLPLSTLNSQLYDPSEKTIQNFVYRYDKFGNLAARKDYINKVEETFTYYRTDNSQSFNRYAYCFYNPLKYTDPSGELMVHGGAFIDREAERYVLEERQRLYILGQTTMDDNLMWESRFAMSLFTWGDPEHANGGGGHDNSGATNGYGGKGGWCKDKSGNISYNSEATISTPGFLGITYLDKGTNNYYGLFGGNAIDLNTEKGRFCQAVDQALINYAEYSRELAEYYSNYSIYSDQADPTIARTDFSGVEDYIDSHLNNDNVYVYDKCYYDNAFGVLARCQSDENMLLTFDGWSESNTLRKIRTYNQSLSTNFDPGYILCFGYRTDNGAYRSAFVVIRDWNDRMDMLGKFNRIFGF